MADQEPASKKLTSDEVVAQINSLLEAQGFTIQVTPNYKIDIIPKPSTNTVKNI